MTVVDIDSAALLTATGIDVTAKDKSDANQWYLVRPWFRHSGVNLLCGVALWEFSPPPGAPLWELSL